MRSKVADRKGGRRPERAKEISRELSGRHSVILPYRVEIRLVILSAGRDTPGYGSQMCEHSEGVPDPSVLNSRVPAY